MIGKSWTWIGVGILGLFFIFTGATPAAADNFITVTTSDDLIAADQFCSLREAIIAANSNAGNGIVGECAPGSDSETDVIQILL